MSSIRKATAPFRPTWKSLPDSCANYRCVTEYWNDLSKRKTYLECDARNLKGNWNKSRFYLDENIKAAKGGMDYLVIPSYRDDTLSSNLVSPHPKVVMKNGKLDLTAHGQGPNGPVWRTVTLHDLMNEDGVVFSSGGGLSPKGLAVRLAWIEADEAKKAAEKIKRDAARKALEPQFKKEWLELLRKQIEALEEMRGHLPPGKEDPWVETRIKEIQTDMATMVPSMPDSWVSEKLKQLSEQDEKAK